MRKGMVFGVFDALHEGHKHFIEDARSQCAELVVVVAKDEAVQVLKGRRPKEPLSVRMETVKKFFPDVTAVPGDAIEGEWKVFQTYSPDMVFLGYDQKALGEELSARGVSYIYLSAHEPEHFKSSILRGALETEGGDGE